MLSDDDIIDFIFKSNFSTNEHTDLLSGRGIGLDVVINELEKLHGTVKVITSKNKGSKFIFTIPYNQTNYSKELKYKDEHKILEAIVQSATLFITKDINDKIVDISPVDSKLLEYYSVVSLNGKVDMFCIISFDEILLDKFLHFFIPYKNTDNIVKKELIDTLPSEIVNTIVGLAIVNFPKEYKNITMSEPLILDRELLTSLRNEQYSAAKRIDTKYGTLICEIIKG